jgi:hypothetical protein
MAGVVLHRLLRQAHARSDLPVREAFPDQPQHGSLLIGEELQPVGARRSGLRRTGDSRGDLVEQRAACGDDPHGRHQGRPPHLLQQEPRRPRPDGRVERLLLGVTGQDEAAQGRHPRAQPSAEVGAVTVGQPHVDDGDVGAHRRHAGQCLGGRPRLARNGDAGVVLEHLGHAAPHDLVIVDEKDAHRRGVGLHGQPPPFGTRRA